MSCVIQNKYSKTLFLLKNEGQVLARMKSQVEDKKVLEEDRREHIKRDLEHVTKYLIAQRCKLPFERVISAWKEYFELTDELKKKLLPGFESDPHYTGRYLT